MIAPVLAPRAPSILPQARSIPFDDSHRGRGRSPHGSIRGNLRTIAIAHPGPSESSLQTQGRRPSDAQDGVTKRWLRFRSRWLALLQHDKRGPHFIKMVCGQRTRGRPTLEIRLETGANYLRELGLGVNSQANSSASPIFVEVRQGTILLV